MPLERIPGEEIERRSLNIIDREVGEHNFDSWQWPVVRRMIHATADFSILSLVSFQGEPVKRGMEAIKRGAPIVTDINMVKSGISVSRLARANPVYKEGLIYCQIADPEVVRQSRESGLPRSVFNMRSLKEKIDGGIVCIGNAPTALGEVYRLVKEDGVEPALVIAMPVGFVNVTESKELTKELSIPYILVEGRRGGTSLAVAALNAISILAINT